MTTASTAAPPLTPKQRLLRALARAPVDRPPVICTGGSMSAAVRAVLGPGAPLPAAHRDPVLMARLSERIRHVTGFENLGTPLCMTVEAEALGGRIDLGSSTREPTIAREGFAVVADARLPPPDALLAAGRVPVLLEATRILARDHPDLPVIVNLNGPTSSASSVLPAPTFLKATRREPERLHRLVSDVAAFLRVLASELIDRGAAVVAIHDDTAAPQTLGPTLFQEYTVRHLAGLIAHIRSTGVPVIVHLCGDLTGVLPALARLAPDALSLDAATSVRTARRAAPALPLMGNVSTTTLDLGTPDRVRAQARRLLDLGVDVLAPGCGLAMGTPLANIRALTGAVGG